MEYPLPSPTQMRVAGPIAAEEALSGHNHNRNVESEPLIHKKVLESQRDRCPGSITTSFCVIDRI